MMVVVNDKERWSGERVWRACPCALRLRDTDANGRDGNLELFKKKGSDSRETTRRAVRGLDGFEGASRWRVKRPKIDTVRECLEAFSEGAAKSCVLHVHENARA